MTLTVRDNIMPFVGEELEDLSRRYPQHGEALRHAVEEFRTIYGERMFSNIADLTSFCTQIDQMDAMRNMHPSLIEPIRESRRAILARIAQQDLRDHPPTIRDMDPDREIRGPRNGENRGRPRSQQELEEVVLRYISLASQLGEDEYIQTLIALNRLSVNDIPRAIRTLRMFLGRSRRAGGGGGGGIEGVDEEILQIQGVRRVVNRMLLRTIYSSLVGMGGDSMEHHERVRSRAGREARSVMEDLARRSNVNHRDMRDVFTERRAYFEQAAALHVPDCFVRTIQHQGELHPLPSWRQRIAVMEAQRQQHIIIGFEPGLGKTFIPIWLYELLAEQRLTEGNGRGRMLFLGPKISMSELPNRIRPNTVQGIQGHSYYTSQDLAPTVGVITDGLTAEEVAERMDADVVFCPYTMLNQVKGDISISDRLSAHRQSESGEPFTMLVADECHKVKGQGDWTQRVRHIIHQTSQLYRNGNVLFMSGTPATNTLADLRVVAELLEPEGAIVPESQNQSQQERTLHPAFMRNMLERLIILDPPGNWLDHVQPFPYDISPQDHRLLRSIINDQTRHAKNKIDTCLRIIRSTDNMLGYTCAQLEEYLEQRNTVLVAENIHAQGVTREWDEDENENGDENDNVRTDPIFRDRLHEYLLRWSEEHGIPVRFHVIDGETNKTTRQREAIYSDAADSDRTGTSKTVILAQSHCINESIDLRFIRRMIALEWPWNSPELQQLLQRSLRAGNEDIFLTAFFAEHTLEHGIQIVAQDKYTDVRHCLYGQGLTDRQLRRAGEDDSEMSRNLRILQNLQSPEQREEFMQRMLQGRGMKRYQKFWERPHNREFFREHLEQADTSGIGNAERFMGSLIAALEEASVISGNQYLHTHSRGLTLDRMLHRIAPRNGREVISMDPVEYMLEQGHEALRANGHMETPRILRGGLTHLNRFLHRGQLQRGTLDAVVLEGLENTHNSIPRDGRTQYSERLRALVGAIRTLRIDGTLIIAIPRGACTQEEFGRFCQEALPRLGCTVLNPWTGEGRSTDYEVEPAFRMFTVVARKEHDPEKLEFQSMEATAMQFTNCGQWGETQERTRFENARRRRKLPYQLVHSQFQIGRHEFGTGQQSEEHARQVVHLRAIQEAVEAVRSLAPTAAEFNALPTAERDELLADINVRYLPRLSPTKKRPAFQLTSYPDFFFYPYDPQWKETNGER